MKKAFSLIEIMIVVAIIGILVSALLPQITKMIDESKASSARRSLSSIRDAVVKYKSDRGEAPPLLSMLVPKYITEIKSDPWGIPFSINREIEIVFSAGPDKFAMVVDPYHPGNRDNIVVSYGTPLRIRRAYLSLDKNGNRKLNNGDRITVEFTRVITTLGQELNGEDFVFFNDMTAIVPVNFNTDNFVRSTDGYEILFAGWGIVNPFSGATSSGGVQMLDPVTGINLPGNYVYSGDVTKGEDVVILEANSSYNWEYNSLDLYLNITDDGQTKIRDLLHTPCEKNTYNTKIEF